MQYCDCNRLLPGVLCDIYNYTKKSRDITITSYCNVCLFCKYALGAALLYRGAQNRSWRIRAVSSSSPPVKQGTTAVAPLARSQFLRSLGIFPIADVPQALRKSRTFVQHAYVLALVSPLRRTSRQQLQILVWVQALVSCSKQFLNWDRLVPLPQGCLSSKS